MSSKKQMHKMACLVVLLGIIASGQICTVVLASPTNQDSALVFIEEVLPINPSQWHIELKVDAKATDMSAQERLAMNDISTIEDDEVLIYFLGSMVGTADSLEVIFILRAGNFSQGIINIDNAPSYNTFGRSLEMADITDFLANYQRWSGLDSSKMSEMLPNTDIAKNASISSNGISLTIQHSNDTTELSWASLNGSELRDFQLTFKKDFPISFKDEHQSSPSNLTITPTSTTSSQTSNDDVVVALTVAIVVVAIIILIGLALLAKKKQAISRRMHAIVRR